MGGGNALEVNRAPRRKGLSPRGRGKLDSNSQGSAGSGSIPAWAGETRVDRSPPAPRGVYPRVGGGNPVSVCIDRCSGGLSPRGRGKHPKKSKACRIKGSIPAWAGETLHSVQPRIARKVYPRVGGGNRRIETTNQNLRGLSPRGRGKRGVCCGGGNRRGSIPAWAGETPGFIDALPLDVVYPRVGGGNCAHESGLRRLYGLSPRGRGKRR